MATITVGPDQMSQGIIKGGGASVQNLARMTFAEKRVQKLATQADDFQTTYRTKTDLELGRRLGELRTSLAGKPFRRSRFLPEALGIIAEQARRTLAEEPIAYHCQLVTAVHLVEGRIVELPNGEGKTLACALAAALTAYFGQPCHIATYNSYLAKRDLLWMGPLYLRLGLRPCAFLDQSAVGVLELASPDVVPNSPAFQLSQTHGGDPVQAKEAGTARKDEGQPLAPVYGASALPALAPSLGEAVEYVEVRGRRYRLRIVPGAARNASEGSLRRANVVYGTITDFIFRHLNDNQAFHRDELAFPELTSLIIDECDFALIDSADQPHRIVAALFDLAESRRRELVPHLFGVLCRLEGADDYDRLNRFRLTAQGEQKVRAAFGWGPLLSEEYSGLAALIDEMLSGLYGLRQDVDYVVANGGICPIDAATGRPRSGGRFEFGAHEALLLKHGIERAPSKTIDKPQGEISVQHFVRLYRHVCGLSASALWYAREFRDLYGLTVVEVKPRFASKRIDRDDVVFRTRYEKFVHLIDLVIDAHSKGQPVLVDCPDIPTAELIARALNAPDGEAFASVHREFLEFAERQVERLALPRGRTAPVADENQIAAQFNGLLAADPHAQLLTAKNLAEEAEVIARAGGLGAVAVSAKMAGRGTDIRVGDEADAHGGLLVIGFDRNRSRHIDQQIRGRTARQGRHGTTLFLASLEDELMVFSANPRVTAMMETLGIQQGEEVASPILNRSLEAAQRRMTRLTSRERYDTFRFDEVMDRHRTYLMKYRRGVLEGTDLCPDLAQMIRNIIVRNVDAHLRTRRWSRSSDAEVLVEKFRELGPFSRNELEACIDEGGVNRRIAKLGEVLLGRFEAGVRQAGAGPFCDRLRPALLLEINAMWGRYLGRKQEIYRQLAAAGALRLEAGVSFEQYQLELNTAYWREIAAFEEQAIAEVFRVLERIDAEAAAEPSAPRPAGAEAEEQDDPRSGASGQWVRFRPAGIRTVSLEMLRSVASDVVAARDFVPVLGAFLIFALACAAPLEIWDLERLGQLVPLRSNVAALLGFPFGPAIFYGGVLLLGCFPLLLFSGLRAFSAEAMRAPPLVVGIAYALAVSTGLHALGISKSPGAVDVLTYLTPLALLLLFASLFDPLKTIAVGFAVFLLSALPVGGALLFAASWLPSWLPFIGTCCVIGVGLYAAYQLHAVLTRFWKASLWQAQTLLLSLMVLFELFRGAVWLNALTALAVCLLLALANRRVAALGFGVEVVDLSGSNPSPARHTIRLPHKAIYLLTALITVAVACLLSAAVALLARLDLFPSVIGQAERLIWPIAAVLVAAHFLVNQRLLLWVNRLLSRRLLRELRRRYTILRTGDGRADASEQLAREFLSRVREVFFVALGGLLVVWSAETFAPQFTGAPLRFPLGVGGFVIVCGLFSDAFFAFVHRLLARIQVRNADQALIGERLAGAQPIVVKPFGSGLMERQRAVLEDFWAATRTDKLLFLKQILRLHRRLGAAPELKPTPADLLLSILFRSFLVLVAVGVAYQSVHFFSGRADPLKPWFWAAFAAGVLVIVLLSAWEYRSLKGEENAEAGEGELFEDEAADEKDSPARTPARVASFEPPGTLKTRGVMKHGLVRVSGGDGLERVADVVFVHGLDGDAYSTWHPRNRDDLFWLAWLGEEFPRIGVWTLGYAVSSTAWKGHSMPLADRATNVLDLMDLDGIGQRPLLFVCHSLGGLLIKQALRHACDSKNAAWKAVAQKTRAIVFLSTPHSGSDLANWVEYIGTVLRATVSVKELRAHDSRLLELNRWYRDHAGDLGITTFVYCEKLATKGLHVVNETSADPGIPGVQPIPLDEDHVTICKPTSRQSQVYRRVRQLIADMLLAKAQPAAGAGEAGRGLPSGPVVPPAGAVLDLADKGESQPGAAAKRHVFLSYCRENQAEVAQLRHDLVAAGERVWWDQDILPGHDWKFEIHKAMKNSSAVVLCLSQQSEARARSGIYPEAADAIALLRECAPGSVFLIPVRLSECEIPPLEIDSTRTLDRLHYVDLFPAEKRSDGLAKLIRAIRASSRRD